jgi:Flp pilus assembly protein TadG
MKVRRVRGGSAAEFAIIAPVLVLLLFGIIEFGLILYDQAMITNASREGARAGIVYSYPDRIGDGEITNVVTAYCADHLVSFGSGSALSISIQRSGTATGDTLTVQVTYPYTFLVLPNFITSLGGQLNLTAESVMRME